MVRKKDRFWEYVEKQNNGRFQCKYCKSIFAGGATRIKYHLAGAKGHDINICTKVPKEVQEEASLTIGEPNKKLKGVSTSNNDKEREISSTSISKDEMLSGGVFEKSKAEYIAEILLGVFVEGLLAKLRSIVIEQHISFELGFKEGLTDLFSFLTQIQLVLNDVEKRQASDEFLRIWLAKLRYVAYDIDDVLDEFGYNILQQKLIHLRLLHILHTKIEELPKSITKLYNLQTLRIEECPKLMELPEDLSNLINLRHINIYVGCWMETGIRYRDCLLKNTGRLTSLQTLNFFSVGRDEGYRIKEMGPLKNLRGEVDIYHLEKVKDEEEAKSAKLKEKEIFKLGLYWEYSIAVDKYDKDEKVLEGLHPHPNLKSLTIEYYGGKKFPSWVNDLSLFHNLIHIKLNFCMECEEVPTLGQLPCLRVLEINHMYKIRSIGGKFYSCDGNYRNTTTLFPALRILKLLSMSSLEEWKDAKELTSACEVLLVFPCLEELIINGCHKLRDLPGVPSVIQHLEIIRCGIDELPSGLQFCASLQYLKIEDCPNLKSIPESLHTCVSLQNFVVKDCPEVRSLPGVPSVIQCLEIIWCGIDELSSGLQFCPSLQYLKIGYCPNLKSIPESLQTYVSLQNFVVENCPELRSLPGVPSVIQQLEIIGCGIDELSSGLQFCTSLQYLKIGYCSNLKSIPESLHTCVSLQNFVVENCPKLRSLPGVPSVIQRLEIIGCGIDELLSGLQFCTSLQYLKIEDCRNLKSIPDLGEVFHSLINLKISHCPDLRLMLRREGRLKTLEIGGFIEELDAFPILRYPSIQYSHASLKKLILLGRPTLDSLPNEIQLFTALEELLIQNFNRMEALPDWLSYLSCLQKLSLYYCKKLMYLPILNLTNLKHLHIGHCRNLEKRCAVGSGAEWFQILHVTNIIINEKYIQGKYSEGFHNFHDFGCEEYGVFDVDSEDDLQMQLRQYAYCFQLVEQLIIIAS